MAKTKNTDWRDLDRDDLIPLITEAREEGKTWGEIREESGGMSLGKLMFLWEIGQVKPKDRIKGEDEDELADAFQEAREANLSWGIIAARAGMPPGRVRKIYEDKFGEGSSTLEGGQSRVAGKRGVVREDSDDEEKPKPKPKKAAKATKSAKGKAAKSQSNGKSSAKLESLDLDALAERLNGRTITVENSKTGKTSRVGVKEVRDLSDGEMEFVSKSGAIRTIRVAAITKASK